MAEPLEEADSPFARAAREGLVGGADGAGEPPSAEGGGIPQNASGGKSAGRPGRGRELAWIDPFLAAIGLGYPPLTACRTAGVDPTTVYRRRRTDPAFAARWNEVADVATRCLEQEVARRAYHGVDRGVWYKGELVGTEKHYSDILAMFLLKARRPEKYRDGTTAAPSPAVINIQVATLDRPPEPRPVVPVAPPLVVDAVPPIPVLAEPAPSAAGGDTIGGAAAPSTEASADITPPSDQDVQAEVLAPSAVPHPPVPNLVAAPSPSVLR